MNRQAAGKTELMQTQDLTIEQRITGADTASRGLLPARVLLPLGLDLLGLRLIRP